MKKQFVIRISLMLVLLAGVDRLVGISFSYLADKALSKAPNAMRTEHTIKKVHDDVIILGSSRANHHYNPSILEDSIDLSVFNCGKDGKPFYYSAAMFDAITERYSPKLVVFDIEPRMLEHGFTTYEDAYELNPFYDENELFRQIINKKSKTEPIKMLSHMYRYNSRAVAIVGKLFVSDFVQYKGYAPISTTGYKYIESMPQVTYDDTAMGIDEFTLYLLNHTIEKAKQKDIQIIFSVSPRYQQSNIDDVNSWKYLNNILSQNHIPLIYNGDTSLIDKPEYFKDIAHLNSDGADIFSKHFAKKLKECLSGV